MITSGPRLWISIPHSVIAVTSDAIVITPRAKDHEHTWGKIANSANTPPFMPALSMGGPLHFVKIPKHHMRTVERRLPYDQERLTARKESHGSDR